MSKSRRYQWAVINASGKLMYEQSGKRRAIYKTREQARLAAKVLGGRPVRRMVADALDLMAQLPAPELSTATIFSQDV
jgi:hypothetical protein